MAPSKADSQPTTSILAWHDLPKGDRRSAELSGIAWQAETSTLYAITDDAPMIVPLMLSDDYQALSMGEPIAVSMPDPWDGEGIALTSEGFIVSNEVGPHVYRINPDGQLVSRVSLPVHFSRIRPNHSLESLAVAEAERYVITANEQALEDDGPPSTIESGTLVRILRYDQVTAETLEWAYRTDPVPSAGSVGDNGVTEIVALSPSDLLVLERSFVPGLGNSIRIYRVTVEEPTDILSVEALSPDTPVLSKTLVVDLGTLPDDDFPTGLQPQPNRILDNFEGMALGPTLADGRRVLFLVSDDNKRATQIPRLLVLAVAGL
jgi:3-phytase